MKLSDVLETVEWGEKNFGSVVTGGGLTKRNIDSAISKGLVKRAGRVTLCDDDGFTIQPERYREGYRLTAKGRRMLKAFKKQWEKQEAQ